MREAASRSSRSNRSPHPLNDFSGVAPTEASCGPRLGKVIYQYDYATNTFSDSFTVSGVAGRFDGMGFSPDGVDLWLVNSRTTSTA